MGSGVAKQTSRVNPQDYVTRAVPAPEDYLTQHRENQVEVFGENWKVPVLDEGKASQDKESLAQTLKKYKQNHPSLALPFQKLFDETNALRQLGKLDMQELWEHSKIVASLSDKSVDTFLSSGTSKEPEYTKLTDFLVDIDTAAVLKRLAGRLFEQYFQLSSQAKDTEDNQSLSSAEVDLMDINANVLGSTLITLQNFADFHDGFCSACASAGVISMCFGAITRIEEEIELSWETENENGDSVPVALITSTMGILHNISRRLRDRRLFANCNSEETLLRFANIENASIASGAILCLAYLVDEDTNHLILADERLLQYIIRMLDVAWQSEDSRCDGFSAKELAEGLRHLAINDTNKKVLGEKGAIPILVSMLRTSKDDGDRASGANALWMLAFDEKNKERIRQEEGALDCLRQLQHNDNPDVQKAAAGALWELEGRRARNAGSKEASGNHVMISYQWDTQNVMVEVKNGLQTSGYRVWMDLEQMGGSTLESMAKAVENASVVLVCVSQKYKESPNCRSEAEYAYQLRKDIIPLMVQRNYKPDGWLGMIVGTKLWIDFKSKHVIDSGIQKLVKELGSRGKDVENVDMTDAPLIQRTDTEVLTASRPISEVSNWTNRDVQQWLKEIGLEDVCTSASSQLDGQALIDLQELREECPEYFYKCLEQSMNLTDVFHLLKFRKELSKLISH